MVGASLAMLAVLAVILFFFGAHKLLAGEVDVAARLEAYGPLRRAKASERSSSSPIGDKMEKAFAGSDFATNVQRELAKANLKLTVAEYVIISATSVLGLAAITLIITHTPAGALVGAAIGFYLPRFYVTRKQKARQKAFNNQLADVIVLVANALRSGYSLLQSLELISREAAQPSAEEFSRVVREVNLGLTPEEALAHLVRRIDSEDLDMMVTAINVQHEVGGNLAVILDSIAETIRERVRIKGEIKSLTAQQTMSGYVITALPIGLGIILFLMNSKYMMGLFSLQTVICAPAIVMPICSGVLVGIGFLVMRKICNIEV